MVAASALLVAKAASAVTGGRSTARIDWHALRARVGHRLIKIESPLAKVVRSGGQGADALFEQLRNPYFLGDDPALTQNFGWTDAWTSRSSAYAVAAQTADDVAAAINFARTRHLRIVVKGGGHSYFGNSNAADSLLIWTRRMNSVEMLESFIPHGGPALVQPVAAVTVGAGAMWGAVYREVAVKNGRYVQGGGCLTVGVAGFTQGGGFGSFSKAFGTGAANLIEAEIVTADGQIRIVNDWNEPELFFALKGGGGGSFGVVTRLTMRTHDLPDTIGAVLFEVEASSERAWRALIARVVEFYATTLFNPVWGEQIRFSPGRTMSISMLFHGIDGDKARRDWKPMLEWLGGLPSDYVLKGDPAFIAVPGRRFWDPDFLRAVPGIVLGDDRAGAPASNIYWAANRNEVGQILHAYESAWLPATLLRRDQQAKLVEALVAAAAEWTVTLHTNKGLAGGGMDAVARSKATATNPAMLDAFALLICAADGVPAWPGIAGHEPDPTRGRRDARGVARAMVPIHKLVPNAGCYMSEANYFATDWKRAYWGAHYRRLAAAKRRYDPEGLFRVHHGVEAS